MPMHSRLRALVLAAAIGAVLVNAGCGGPNVVVQSPAPQQQPPPPRQAQANAPASGDSVGGGTLVLGRDLDCQHGNIRLQVLASGQFYVDGQFVGTLAPEGGFSNVKGIEIGRLYPDGRMQFANAIQDAIILGNETVGPQGAIARIDAGGNFIVVGGSVPPAPVRGITTASVRTFLFAFSMYAALLATAQHMGLL